MTTRSSLPTTIDQSANKPEKKKSNENKKNINDYNNARKRIDTMKQKTKGVPSRIECPCHNYTALSKIVDIICSKDRSRTDSMIDWLNGSTDNVAIREKKLLTCGKRFKCRFRYGTSFAILRAIRDASAPFQTASATVGDTSSTNSLKENSRSESETSKTIEVSAPTSYDQSFPPLSQHPGISNILIPPTTRKSNEKKLSNVKKKSPVKTPVVRTLNGKKKKPKKRVQPLLTEVPTLTRPRTLFGDASIQQDMETLSISDGVERKHNETEKRDTNVPSFTSGATQVVNTLDTTKRKSKRVQPQFVAVKAKSSSCFSNLARDKSNPNTNNNLEATAIDKICVSVQNKSEKSELRKRPTKSSNQVPEEATEQMDRLVDIYIALMRNMLIPSTPLEIHLLLELLLIETDRNRPKQLHINNDVNEQASVTASVTTSATASALFFQPIFYSPERCIEFGQKVMTRYLEGVIQRLSPFLIKSLLGDSVFLRRCPTVAQHLNTHLLSTTTASEWTPPTSESVTGTHAIFSLPFEPDRDSRHNFKTQAEISMYQNRESTRDAFLSQLREFITAKSKVFLPREVDKVRETAQYESRKIIANLFPHNMLWFAQFFCELLLQVGLAPVEEMDQELLQIADDRDKLQKLHKRFFKKNPSRPSQSRASFGSSTTPGHRNERYRNFNDGNRNEIKYSKTSAFQEALPYFPGYQEFFFIFLHSVDSYNFGMHLLHQLVSKTSDMILNCSVSGLEKRTLDLGLLARFLGCLIFSPNWQEENIDLSKLKPCLNSLDHGLDLLEAIGLPISKLVEESWDGGYTFLVIPWVTELLKMSKWDSISQSSMTFRQILANLRFVQCVASRSSPEGNASCDYNTLQVFFHLETFFNEIFTLPKLTSLPDSTLTPHTHTNQNSLNCHKVGLSKAAIYTSSPHMEDLCDMIMLSKKAMRQDTKNSITKPKKLKPSVVSTAVDVEARSYLGVESPRGKVIPTLKNVIQRAESTDNTLHGKLKHAKNKLSEGFFHQHRDLKEICDFAIQQTLKDLPSNEMREFVMKASKEFSIGVQSTEIEIEEMQASAFEQSQILLRSNLSDKLTKSLELFCAAGTNQRVIDIAATLATDRGMEDSHVVLRDFIASSTKTILKQLDETNTAVNHCSDKSKIEIDQATESATESIRNLREKYSTLSDDDTNTKYIMETLDHVELVTKSVLIPREALLRDFFQCILGLDPIAELVINKFVESGKPESWVTLCTFFRLLQQLALVSGYWRNRINTLFRDDLVDLMSTDEVPTSNDREKIIEKLQRPSVGRELFAIAHGSGGEESKHSGVIDPKKIEFT